MDPVSIGRSLISADSVNQPIRVNATYSQGGSSVYTLRLEPPEARSLGLREGQSVNGVIANRADGNVFLTGSKAAIMLPSNFAAAEGKASFIATALVGGAMLLSLQPDKARKVGTRLSIDRIHSLLGRAIQNTSISGLFSFSKITNMLAREPRLGSLFSSFQMSSFEPNAQTAEALKASLYQSGLFHESEVLKQNKPNLNLKTFLLLLKRGHNNFGADLSQLNAALDELESFQLESLGNQLNRNTALSWLIPVLNDWPILAHVESREGSEEGSEDDQQKEWKVDLRVSLSDSEHLDVSLIVSENDEVRLNCWTDDADFYHEALNHLDWLKSSFGELGISLHEVNLFPVSKRSESSAEQIGYASDLTKTSNGISIDV